MSEDDLRDLFGQESPFSDFFGDLYGGAGGTRARSVPRKGSDMEAEVTVSLEDAFRGTTITLTLTDASGAERRIEATIPRGVRDGSRIRLAGQGNPGRNGGPPGDIYLVISIAPHPRFRREGDDLRVEVPVDLTICMLGGDVQVQTLKGSRLSVRIPPETQNGTAIRLRGQGMPHLKHPATAGDLYVEVRVVLPTRLTAEERALFVRLAELRGQPVATGGAA
jgi:curved DNA-binding protein